MYSDTIEALKKCGYTILLTNEVLVKVGRKNYLVKSVFSGENHLDEILISLAQSRACNALKNKNQRSFLNDET